MNIREEADQIRIDAELCRVCELRYDQHDGRELHRFEGANRRQYTPDELDTVERASWSINADEPTEEL
jgi:hypothetical protein